MLAEYPNLVALCDQHKAILDAAFENLQPPTSELTFAYQWIWRRFTDCHIGRFGDALLLTAHKASMREAYFLPPLAADLDTAEAIIRKLLGSGQLPSADSFARVPDYLAQRFSEEQGFVVDEERDRADYVYLAEDLRELPGRRFRNKRNAILQFRRTCPAAKYVPMDNAIADRCAAFCRHWIDRHHNSDLPGLQREVETTLHMLARFQWLGLTGGAMLVDGRLVAFALGEALNRDTFVIRVEKADASIPGAYQVIGQEFARHAAAGYKWINREQDLGLPGLRQAKQSYHPTHLVRKYRISARRSD